MQNKNILWSVITLCFIIFIKTPTQSQYLMDMIDTTKNMGQEMLGLYKKFNAIRLSGYIQPQFQIAESQGVKSYEGGDFAANVNNRFILRRARVRTDYVGFSDHKTPKFQIAFQFDATERGVVARDVWGRIFENKYDCFAFTTGLFARPFGFEVNLSSSDRESPERGRMSQILMRTERDLGMMVTFAPQKKDHPLKRLQVDAGIFNGQGLAGPLDFDSYKDFISRVQWKRHPLSKKAFLSLGLSYLNGGIRQNNKTFYEIMGKNTDFTTITDSLSIGSRSPRQYLGADAQLKFENHFGNTEIRAEYWKGTQTATSVTSETPGSVVSDPLYVRQFEGAFICFLQNLGKKHQLIVKYDFYDPNTHVKNDELVKDTKITSADVKYNTLGVGYLYYMNEHIKFVFYQAFVKNEKTRLTGLTDDLKDNIFTFRVHYRF
jgi:hypothetical protein